MMLGYARVGVQPHTLESQFDALTQAGVDPQRIYSDHSVGARAAGGRPGLAELLRYARPGDVTVVVGIDRLGRTTREVLTTARELSTNQIGLRSLREGLDTDDTTGAMIVGVLASLAELDKADGPARRTSGAGTHGATGVGRPRALDGDQVAFAERMRADGQPVGSIAAALGVSRATLYRTLAERRSAR
ncbi:recombinase family protein [Gordonia sp. PKS22-38]|uniref:Recombinase family protein n=1 Tax=Gordonia prachuapensis TaxID=3115651 RepID=A0ABU7MWM2_9ACTN|nr:recombinase family protein [Gordonia sp. PKS22-38]